MLRIPIVVKPQQKPISINKTAVVVYSVYYQAQGCGPIQVWLNRPSDVDM
jgi:hypothetical protein